METTVARLFVHGTRSTRPEDTKPTAMLPMSMVEAVEGMGLREDARYYRQPPGEKERKRQVSLIDEGTIRELEAAFGPIPFEFVKAQIVLAGDVDLTQLIGSVLRFESGAQLEIALERKPCYAMDLIHRGLREAMEGGRQGALGRVTVGSHIALGDAVTIDVATPSGAVV